MRNDRSERRIPSVVSTRLGLVVAVPLALVFGVNLARALSLPKTWNSGDTLTAVDLNANFAAIKSALATERVASAVVSVGGNSPGTATATCSTGNMVLGGGCIFDANDDNCCIVPLASYPDSPTTYTCRVWNGVGATRSIQAYAICAGF